MRTHIFAPYRGEKELFSRYDGGERLVLCYKNLTDQDVLETVIPFLNEHPDISSLDVCGNTIGPEGARALAQLPLEELNISENQIGDEGAKELTGSTKLRVLDVSCNDIGCEGARALAKAALNTLNISSNPIADWGAQGLAESAHLKCLDVSYCRIRYAGIEALSRNTRLEKLDVIGNYVGCPRLHAVTRTPRR